MPSLLRNTAEFNPPPLDMPLEHVLDFNLQLNPSRIALVHPGRSGECIKSYTFEEFVPAIHRAGRFISEKLDIHNTSIKSMSKVVAILIKTDTMTYITVIAGILRAGLTPFPISPRFSPAVVLHLLQEAQPLGIVVNDDATSDMINEILTEHSTEYYHQPVLCHLPAFTTMYPGHNIYTPLQKHERKPGDISLMLHSSSTSSIFPKLVPWSSATLTHHAEVEDVTFGRVSELVLGCFGTELFHGYGMVMFFMMIRRGLVLAVMDPTKTTSIFPVDSEDIYHSFLVIQPDILALNARVLESWANDEEKVNQFRESSVRILYGGQPLNKTAGDKLVQNGVKVCSGYGSTEGGTVILLSNFLGSDWQYWTMYYRPDLHFAPRSDGLWEIFQDAVDHLPFTNATWKGRPAYNPGDLFVLHPTKPNTYKFFGRAGDQIMLATGEFINPTPIEEEIINGACLSTAVLFGHYRPRAGIIVQPKEAIDDDHSLEHLFNEVWSTIQTVNAKLPLYSRIMREMIIIAHPKKSICLSPKGLPRRSLVVAQYQAEIDSLYMRE